MYTDNYSLIFNPATLANSGENVVISADDTLRRELAKELNVLAVSKLEIDLRVVRWQKLGIKVSGSITGQLDQACVATLEPVPEAIDIEVDRSFLPDGKFVRRHDRMDEGELVVDPDTDDDPDEMPPGGVEIWDVIIEEINLSLNPFPRTLDAPNDASVEVEKLDEEDTYKPFADLNALINEKKSKN